MGGCCGKITEDQREDICRAMAKEMMLISVPDVLKKPDAIKIPMPEAFNSFKQASNMLREMAPKVPEQKAEEASDPEAAPAPAEPEKKTGMFDKVSKMAQQGMGKAAEIGAKGVAMGVNVAADALDAPIKTIEEQLSLVAKDILSSEDGFKKVSEVLSNHIRMAALPEPVQKCQGMPTRTAISDYLINKAEASLVTQLEKEIDNALAAHKGIKAWNVAIDSYNEARAKIVRITSQEDILPEIKLDIKYYICECTVRSLNDLLGAREEELRANPGSAPATTNHRDIFIRAFQNTSMLTYNDWKTLGNMPA